MNSYTFENWMAGEIPEGSADDCRYSPDMWYMEGLISDELYERIREAQKEAFFKLVEINFRYSINYYEKELLKTSMQDQYLETILSDKQEWFKNHSQQRKIVLLDKKQIFDGFGIDGPMYRKINNLNTLEWIKNNELLTAYVFIKVIQWVKKYGHKRPGRPYDQSANQSAIEKKVIELASEEEFQRDGKPKPTSIRDEISRTYPGLQGAITDRALLNRVKKAFGK